MKELDILDIDYITSLIQRNEVFVGDMLIVDIKSRTKWDMAFYPFDNHAATIFVMKTLVDL